MLNPRSKTCSHPDCNAVANGHIRPDRCRRHDRLDMPSVLLKKPKPIPCSENECSNMIEPKSILREGLTRWLLIPGACDECVEKLNRERVRFEDRGLIEARLQSSRLPKRTWNLSLDPDCVEHGKQGDTPESFARRCQALGKVGITRANRALAAWLGAWRPEIGGSWVYVTGPVGTGKTTLLTARVADLAREGESVLWLSESALWRFRAGDVAFYDLLDRASRAPVLMLDDFGSTRRPAPWRVDVIEGLIGERYDRRLPTLISSNLTLDEVGSPDLYGLRVADRLSEMIGGEPLKLEASDVGSWRDLLSGRARVDARPEP